MKSRSNSSNKDEKKAFEAKIDIKNFSLETCCGLCLQRLSYKSTEKRLKKNDDAQKPKYSFENKYF